LTGNGAKPTVVLTQLDSMSVAPLVPHFVQRAERRNISLDASGPQRMISGATDPAPLARRQALKLGERRNLAGRPAQGPTEALQAFAACVAAHGDGSGSLLRLCLSPDG
jgi:hypothetical protein